MSQMKGQGLGCVVYNKPDSYKESNEEAPWKNDFDYNLGLKAIILNFLGETLITLDKRHLIHHKIILYLLNVNQCHILSRI